MKLGQKGQKVWIFKAASVQLQPSSYRFCRCRRRRQPFSQKSIDFGLKSYQIISMHLKTTLQVLSSFMQV